MHTTTEQRTGGLVTATTHGPGGATADLHLFSTGHASVAGGCDAGDHYAVSASSHVALSALVQGF